MLKLKDFEVFWDNGKWVAIAEDGTGTRRNYAPEGCKTSREAWEAAREEVAFRKKEIIRYRESLRNKEN